MAFNCAQSAVQRANCISSSGGTMSRRARLVGNFPLNLNTLSNQCTEAMCDLYEAPKLKKMYLFDLSDDLLLHFAQHFSFNLSPSCLLTSASVSWLLKFTFLIWLFQTTLIVFSVASTHGWQVSAADLVGCSSFAEIRVHLQPPVYNCTWFNCTNTAGTVILMPPNRSHLSDNKLQHPEFYLLVSISCWSPVSGRSLAAGLWAQATHAWLVANTAQKC